MMIARARGWVPEGSFRLGQWGWIVSIIAVSGHLHDELEASAAERTAVAEQAPG